MNEEWKDIPGYEGRYQVSNFGRVKSLPREYQTGIHQATIHLQETIMRPRNRKDGYARVFLQKNGEIEEKYIHRLVAQSFLPNENNLRYVNHKDVNPQNNHVDNLEWCTAQYNCRYHDAHIRGGINRRVPIVQKTLDGKFIREWDSAGEAAKEFGRKRPTNIVHSLVSNGTKTAYGYKWEYKR